MRVLCEMSGGADSALAAIYAKKKYPEAYFACLFVNYGQSYRKEERQASINLAEKIFTRGYSWRAVDIQSLYHYQLRIDKVATEYFPLRNLVLTSISAAVAYEEGAEVIVTGSKSLSRVPTDPYSFRDSALPFYTLMEATINGAIESGRIRVEPVLAMGRDSKMDKLQVYKELMEEGFNLNDFWSCYHPTDSGNECGQCRNCMDKEVAKNRLRKVRT